MQAELDALLALVDDGRPDEAVALVAGLLDDGADPDELILGLLAPVQLEVGRRWQAGTWSVAQEHAASAVVTSALGVITNRVRVVADQGRVVVACAEQEWHSLPASFLAQQLRHRGWEVAFLGAATASGDLAARLDDEDADAVVLSCQMSMSLPGLARAIRAVHDSGLPVAVGGAGLGPDDRAAMALGADGWAGNVEDLHQTLRAWVADPPEELAAGDPDEGHLQVLAVRPLLRQVLDEAAGPDWPCQPEDLDHVVGFLAGAVAARDERIFVGHARWLTDLVVRRGGAALDVDRLLAALAAALPAEAGSALRTVDAARDHLLAQGEDA